MHSEAELKEMVRKLVDQRDAAIAALKDVTPYASAFYSQSATRMEEAGKAINAAKNLFLNVPPGSIPQVR
jgi:hypothetical protein